MALTSSQEVAYKRIMSWYENRESDVFKLGGPAGSGKSYLIALVAEAIGVENCLLITPTGKAANNLIKAALPARTIHSQIYHVQSENSDDGSIDFETSGESEFKNLANIIEQSMNRGWDFGSDEARFILKEELDARVKCIIIDEGSMVGGNLLNDVLSFGIPTLLVGDPNQLPPVNDTSVFRTCDYYLTEIVRQAQGSPVIYLSQEVLQGRLKVGSYGSCMVRKGPVSDEELCYADIVLTDTNVSRTELNNRMRRLALDFRQMSKPLSVGDRVICRTNTNITSSDGFALTNGAQGVISKIKHNNQNYSLVDMVMETPDIGTFSFVGTTRPELFPSAIRPPKIEYGYALTVHLSQGSEWQNVIYQQCSFMKKSAIYTAITRAKDSVLIALG
jgi:exodeoxyribonuclease-5